MVSNFLCLFRVLEDGVYRPSSESNAGLHVERSTAINAIRDDLIVACSGLELLSRPGDDAMDFIDSIAVSCTTLVDERFPRALSSARGSMHGGQNSDLVREVPRNADLQAHQADGPGRTAAAGLKTTGQPSVMGRISEGFPRRPFSGCAGPCGLDGVVEVKASFLLGASASQATHTHLLPST